MTAPFTSFPIGTSLAQIVYFFDTRTLAISATIPSTVDAIRTGGYTTFGDHGGGLYLRVASQPSHAGKLQSADGTWWELFAENDEVWLEQFGGIADFVGVTGSYTGTDNFPMLANAQAYIVAKAWTDTIWTFTKHGIKLRIGPGVFLIGSTFEMDGCTYTIEGMGPESADVNATSTVLRFPTQTHGFIIQNYNTTGFSTIVSNKFGAQKSSVKNITFFGSHNPGVDSVATRFNGITCRTIATLRGNAVLGFSGNGIAIQAEAPVIADTWLVSRCDCSYNGGNGLYVVGSDANAGKCEYSSFLFNGRWGVADFSFLGNTYDAIHTEANGLFGQNVWADTPHTVVHNSRLWQARVGINDQNGLGGTYSNEPGTDPNSWRLLSASQVVSPSALYPAWNALTTYTTGGGYATNNSNSRNVFTGCYAEDPQENQIRGGEDLWVGGLSSSHDDTTPNLRVHDRNWVGLGISRPQEILGGSGTGSIVASILFAPVGTDNSTMAPGYPVIAKWGWDDGVTQSGDHFLARVDNDTHLSLTSREIYRITGNATTLLFGRATTTQNGGRFVSDRLMLGFGNGARSMRIDNTGQDFDAGVGDWIFNRTTVAGGSMGWVCTVAGTPGTQVFTPFGHIANDAAGTDFTIPVVRHTPRLFSQLPASPTAGMVAAISDSTTQVWGATAAGGSTLYALLNYNGTAWTVIGK
jgi:hypothetical protein